MTEHATSAPSAAPRRVQRPWWMAAAGASVVAVVVAALAAGWDVRAWLSSVWDSLTAVSFLYIVPALALQTLSVGFSAAAWYGILRYAYPDAELRYLGVAACYATGVALNNVLPAHAGTAVTVLMFVATIGPATAAGVVAGAAVEKLFFAVTGVLVWLYLFLSVGGSFGRKFGWVSSRPWTTALVAVAIVVAVVVGGRLGWRWLKHVWEQARQGGRILGDRKAYLTRVALPQLLSWCCKLGVVAVLLAAYGIPVGFHTVMSVLGGGSVANLASVTPGGIGVNQAFNVASLREVASSADASAYSVGHQLLTTGWNILLAATLVAVAFGSGGRALVEESLAEARQRKDPA